MLAAGLARVLVGRREPTICASGSISGRLRAVSAWPTAARPGYRDRVASSIRLVEFPADEPARARRFWTELLGVELEDRSDDEGVGWQTGGDGPALGLHRRGTGPGDRVSLPYFSVSDMEASLHRVRELDGEVIHVGERWSVCRDSEGSPFGLALDGKR